MRNQTPEENFLQQGVDMTSLGFDLTVLEFVHKLCSEFRDTVFVKQVFPD